MLIARVVLVDYWELSWRNLQSAKTAIFWKISWRNIEWNWVKMAPVKRFNRISGHSSVFILNFWLYRCFCLYCLHSRILFILQDDFMDDHLDIFWRILGPPGRRQTYVDLCENRKVRNFCVIFGQCLDFLVSKNFLRPCKEIFCISCNVYIL